MSSGPKDKAHEEKNNKIKTHMSSLVYNIFSGRYNYGLLHRSVVLENSLFGKTKTSVGVLSYAIALLKLRLRMHGQFAGTSMEIVNVSFLEDGVIKIQWHMRAVSQSNLLKTLRFIALDADHLDACSYFHVDESGLVKKHRIEKVMPSSKEKADS
ncbi:hypothetical protein BsWGS_09004 [Bradybaena similaris]